MDKEHFSNLLIEQQKRGKALLSLISNMHEGKNDFGDGMVLFGGEDLYYVPGGELDEFNNKFEQWKTYVHDLLVSQLGHDDQFVYDWDSNIGTYISKREPILPQLKKKVNKGMSLIDSFVQRLDFHFRDNGYVEKVLKQENIVNSPKVFISHSSDDKELILSFIKRVLVLGLGLPKDDIVFTSDENYGIEPGGDIPQYIKRNIAHANVVLIMVSHGYKKSEVCLNEMGAAWALDRNIIQVLLPDADFDDLGWVINLKKAIKLNEKNQLISLTKKIATLLSVDMTKHFSDAVTSIDDFLGTLGSYMHKDSVAIATSAPKVQPIVRNKSSYFAVDNPDRVLNEAINKLGEFTIKELQEETGLKDYHYVAEKVISLVHSGSLEEIGPKNRRKYRKVIKSDPLF